MSETGKTDDWFECSIWRIAKEEFRMRMPMYEMVISCVCGLVRLREQYA
jgi:hypothetical protein